MHANIPWPENRLRHAHAGHDVDVTICMALHNPDPFLLERQLTSIDEQIGVKWTGLALDDGSDLVGQGVIEDAFRSRQRWQFLSRKETALGPYLANETLLAVAANYHKPVALADQDDAWHPEKLALELAALENPYQIVVSAMRAVDRNGVLIRIKDPRLDQPLQDYDLGAVLTMNPVHGCAALIGADLARLAVPFPRPAQRMHHDQWIAAVAVLTGGLRRQPVTVVDYTIHPGQSTGAGIFDLGTAVRRKLGRSLAFRPLESLAARRAWLSAAAAEAIARSNRACKGMPYVASKLDLPTVKAIGSAARRREAPLARVGILFACMLLPRCLDVTARGR